MRRLFCFWFFAAWALHGVKIRCFRWELSVAPYLWQVELFLWFLWLLDLENFTGVTDFGVEMMLLFLLGVHLADFTRSKLLFLWLIFSKVRGLRQLSEIVFCGIFWGSLLAELQLALALSDLLIMQCKIYVVFYVSVFRFRFCFCFFFLARN